MNAPFTIANDTIRIANMHDPSDIARIEAYVAANDGNLFQRPAWLRAVEAGTGNRAMGLVAEKCGVIIGWLPLSLISSRFFGRSLVSSGFGVGGGPLAQSDEISAKLCAHAQELAVTHNCNDVELRSDYIPDDWHTHNDTHFDFSFPLQADDEAQLLWIKRRQRAEVRKGLERELTWEVGNDEKSRHAHFHIYATSVRNLGTPVFPRSLFDAMLNEFGDNADILTVYNKGRPISSVLSFYHNGAVLPFWGGGTAEARSLRANDVMYYKLMCHARKNKGCTQFDFGRSKADSGPYHYKKSWGIQPVPLTFSVWTAPGKEPRDISPNSATYAKKVAMWKKLPLPVANFIGPFISRGLG